MNRPGQMALTVTPRGAQSAAVARVKVDHGRFRRLIMAPADAAIGNECR